MAVGFTGCVGFGCEDWFDGIEEGRGEFMVECFGCVFDVHGENGLRFL